MKQGDLPHSKRAVFTRTFVSPKSRLWQESERA
jgi:hypothetical protein